MKKVLFVCLAFAMSLLFTNNTNAQVKIGYYDDESVLGLIPGIQKVDTLLQQYLNDSLKGEYDYELAEFQRKDSTFKKDSATMSPSVKGIMKKEIAQHFYKIQNWQQYQQQMLQQKQDELLYPYKQRIYIALEEVIKEQKYTLVVKSETLIFAQPEDNISRKVAQKLKLPLPKQWQDEIESQQQSKPATGGAKPATKPATRPAGK